MINKKYSRVYSIRLQQWMFTFFLNSVLTEVPTSFRTSLKARNQGCGSGSWKRLNFCGSGSTMKKETGTNEPAVISSGEN